MRHPFWLILLPLFFQNQSARAGVEGFQEIGKFLQEILPEGQTSCALGKAMEVLGLGDYKGFSLGYNNVGTIVYFRDLISKNPCFANKMIEFYRMLENQDLSYKRENLGHGPLTINTMTARNRVPTLTMVAGQGPFAGLAPGWAWKKALALTNGNPNLAISLLASCGNDNINIDYKIPSTKEVNEKRLLEIKDQIFKLKQMLKSLPNSSKEKALLSNQIAVLSSTIRIKFPSSGEYVIYCPEGYSTLFVPRSLGESVDLPDELKTKIAQIQKPQSGGMALSAKYYHFYGGALVGCKMAECGLSPDKAAYVAKFLGSAYRSIRLCDKTRLLLSKRQTLEDYLDINLNSTSWAQEAITELVRNPPADLINQCTNLTRGEKADVNLLPICKLLSQFPSPSNSSSLALDPPDQKIEQEKIRDYLKELDSAVLYRNWYLGGGSIMDLNIPCTDLRLSGPENLKDPDLTTERLPYNPPSFYASSCKIPGWSPERCTRARDSLATWDVDFEWTKAQHEIGARWAATQCKPVPKDFQPDQVMCKDGNKNGSAQNASTGEEGASLPAGGASGR